LKNLPELEPTFDEFTKNAMALKNEISLNKKLIQISFGDFLINHFWHEKSTIKILNQKNIII